MWLVWNAKGIVNVLLTWLLLGAIDLIAVKLAFKPLFETALRPRYPQMPLSDTGLVFLCAYQTVVGFAWLCHVRAVTTDPGSIPSAELWAPKSQTSGFRTCKMCSGWKPPRAHHCLTCKRCIFRMDHHCPWINNCIGVANQKLFALFLGYTALTAVLTFLMLALAATVSIWRYFHGASGVAGGVSGPALTTGIITALVCVGVAKWVGDFLLEQVQSILTNSTVVETYLGATGQTSSSRDQFKDVFGDSWCFWFLPVRASLPRLDYGEPLCYGGGRRRRLTTSIRTELNIASSDDEVAPPAAYSASPSRGRHAFRSADLTNRRSRHATPPPSHAPPLARRLSFGEPGASGYGVNN